MRFKIYFPDGSEVTKYRYVPARAEANELCRACEFLERGSRSSSLSHREIVQARHDKLITEADARALTGGKLNAEYDLDRVLTQYLATISVSHTPVAYKKAAGKAEWVAGWLREHPIPDLTEADVRQYILGRRDGAIVFSNPRSTFGRVGVRPKTIKNELEIVRGLLDEAVVLNMVPSNVARSVAMPVKTSHLRRALNLAEVSRLVTAAAENRHMLRGQLYEFIMTALYTGYRLSELRTLTWDDVNLETRRIFVQSKKIDGEDEFNAKSGVARFNSIADALFPVLSGMERRGRFVFGGDKPFLSEVLSATVKKLMARAGLPGDLSLHHLRHTYGSWLLRQTGDLKLVQERLGHLDVSTTKNYAHNVSDDSDPVRSFDYT